MNLPALRYANFVSIAELFSRTPRPVASIGKRTKKVTKSTRRSVRDGKAKAGLVGYFWGVLHAPPRHCIECFSDIPHATERCPHCLALQQAENRRIRRRDAGWV